MRGYISNRVYYKHEKDSGLLRMSGGSWTINLDEIGNKDIDEFVYTTQTKEYRIDRKLAEEKGFKLMFKGENKMVIPIKNWKVKELHERQSTMPEVRQAV